MRAFSCAFPNKALHARARCQLRGLSDLRWFVMQICSRFSREYEVQTGVPVGFRLSFGGSGTQVGLMLTAVVPQSLCHPDSRVRWVHHSFQFHHRSAQLAWKFCRREP